MFDLHTHTTFSDGRNTPEEMVLAAIEKGMSRIGISDHSFTAFDESYCIAKNRMEEYARTVRALQEKYKDKIEVLLGLEQDFYADAPTIRPDYIIGSVHYLKLGGEYVAVDESEDLLRAAAKRYFDGDTIALVEEYYKTVAKVAECTGADIIGHFDLIEKCNRNGKLYDPYDKRVQIAVMGAIGELLAYGVPFEINTGAMARGYFDRPYPAPEWIGYIQNRGGRFVLSSDSHAKDTLCFGFEDYRALLAYGDGRE